MDLPYTFEPLFAFLEQLDMTPEDLVSQKILLESTLEKIVNGQPVTLSTVAKLCIYLGCDFSEIVSINYAYDSNEQIEQIEPTEPVPATSTIPTITGRQGYNRWTKEEEDRLIEEYNRGENLVMIAKTHNRSHGAISTRINRLIEWGRLNSNKNDNTEYFIPEDIYVSSEDTISISELARRLSVDSHRKLKYEDIASWLVSVDDFEEYVEDGKKIRIPTKQGEDRGIKRGKKKNPAGMEYIGVFLEPAAQKYISENLREIFAYMVNNQESERERGNGFK